MTGVGASITETTLTPVITFNHLYFLKLLSVSSCLVPVLVFCLVHVSVLHGVTLPTRNNLLHKITQKQTHHPLNNIM